MVRTVADSPKVHKKRLREKRTISQMVAIFCKDHHDAAVCEKLAYCGEVVCPECLFLDTYAVKRTDQCRTMEAKTTCEACGNHCFSPEQRAAIREVMRYAGSRMLKRHPIAAIRHLTKR